MSPCTTGEFQRCVSHTEPVHQSYDLDRDGVIGINDYREAKQLDRAGCGVLDTVRQRDGRVKLARNALQHRKVTNSLQQQTLGEATLSSLSGVMADLPDQLFAKHLKQAK